VRWVSSWVHGNGTVAVGHMLYRVQLVELGLARGTLMDDMMTSFTCVTLLLISV
jgi:hypothetical protein